MPKIPPLKPRKLIKILEKTGFKVAHQKGSHIIMMNDKKTRIVIPVHPGMHACALDVHTNNIKTLIYG